MMRKVIALFDEYQSKENAKHVLRNMKLNAQQGFWNGSPVPLGYVLVEVEKRGTKIKKTHGTGGRSSSQNRSRVAGGGPGSYRAIGR
jgi:hypothetical protein